jgi:hypothetical protein
VNGLLCIRWAAFAAIAATFVLSLTAAAAIREPLEIRVFARVGPPGQPEPIAIGPDPRVGIHRASGAGSE